MNREIVTLLALAFILSWGIVAGGYLTYLVSGIGAEQKFVNALALNTIVFVSGVCSLVGGFTIVVALGEFVERSIKAKR